MRQEMKPACVFINPPQSDWSNVFETWERGQWDISPTLHPDTTEYVRKDLYDEAIETAQRLAKILEDERADECFQIPSSSK
jgi:hypothetical protein